MIPTQSYQPIETNTQATQFTMQADAQMFELLTKNIYSNNILAIIREWSCNSVDACIEANLPVKYEVNLPNILNPIFSIRDYGTGLSDEDMLGLFTTAGMSTKRSSNTATGMLGIGRLSGLAYSDSFTVTSWFNGTKSSYVITKKEGIPTALSLGTQPTTEANGLQLSVNVKKQDTSRFKKEANIVYEFFDHKPIISEPLIELDREKEVKGTDWIWNPAYSKLLSSGYRSIYVVMGNIAYKVEYDYQIFPKLSSLFDMSGFCLYLPLGSVTFNPGREALNLDNKTVETITHHLNLALAEIRTVLRKQILAVKGDWAKVLKYKQIARESKIVLSESAQSLQLDHPTLFNEYLKLQEPLIPNTIIRVFHSGSLGPRSFNDVSISSTEAIFMIADIRIYHKEAVQEARNHYQTNPQAIVFKMSKWSKEPADIKQFTKDVTQWLAKLGVTPVLASTYIQQTSSTPNKTQTLRGPVGTVQLTTPQRSTTIHTAKGSPITASNIDTHYYIKTNAFKPADATISTELLSAYIRATKLYNTQKSPKIHLVGIPKSGTKLVEPVPTFIHAKGNIEPLLATIEVPDYTVQNYIGSINGRTYSSLKAVVTDHKDKLTPDFIDWAEKSLEFTRKHPHTSKIVSSEDFEKLLGIKLITSGAKLSRNTIEERYPLLTLMLDHYSFKSENISRYIQLEDNNRKGN